MYDIGPSIGGDSLWMGSSKPKRRKQKAYKKPMKRKRMSYSKAKQTDYIGLATRGYGGSAKSEYMKREKERKRLKDEAKYKAKLRSEYGVKSPVEKIKGFFKKKPKSIYK